jgi:hypothetical protein
VDDDDYDDEEESVTGEGIFKQQVYILISIGRGD